MTSSPSYWDGFDRGDARRAMRLFTRARTPSCTGWLGRLRGGGRDSVLDTDLPGAESSIALCECGDWCEDRRAFFA